MKIHQRKIALSLWFLFVFLCATAQDNAQNSVFNGDTTTVNALLQQSKEQLNEDPAKAINLAMQAKYLAEKLDFLKGKAQALKNVGLGYYYQGKYLETLEYWNESLDDFKALKDDVGVANLLNNIAAIYADQGDDAKALDYSLQSLTLSEKAGDKLRILSALNNIGGIYYNKKATWDKALDYLLKALPICEDLGDQEAFGVISENIGEIYLEQNEDDKAKSYFQRSITALGTSANSSFAYNGLGKLYLREGDFEQSLHYHNKALEIAENAKHQFHIIRSLKGLANVYSSQRNYGKAIDYYGQAIKIAESMKTWPDLMELYGETAQTYKNKGEFKNAYRFQFLYSDAQDTLYNIETNKKLVKMQFDNDLQKKQAEINLLTKDKALSESQLKRQKLVRSGLLAGMVLIVLIAGLLYRNYRNKVKVNKILDSQKVQIENLLLNILPAEVAAELQTKGYATPRYYERVSVLFTDFVGFTRIADTLSSQEVVAELSECFMAFDEIIEKYNLEKIKTIGDSYMCAGGIPVKNDDHPFSIVKASLEIQQYMRAKNDRRRLQGLSPWELRIGVHTGPVVAGVVGKNKYAYDIWGSTVNIASRMESNGEPGKVNISSATYEIVKSKFACIYRGKISAKNIGEIDMYFVDHEKPEMNDYESKINIVSKQTDNSQA